VRTLRALALILGIFAVITIISAAQSESDPRKVVQASEILEKIERGEPVVYTDNVIEGDINIGDLMLPVVRIARSPNEIKQEGLSENLRVVRSPLIIQGCLINGDVDFSNVRILEPASFSINRIQGEANFLGSQFYQSAYFSYSQFNEDADFSYSQFNKDADFSYSQFNKHANFRESLFNEDADFSYSLFRRDANFGRATFSGDLSFEGSRIDSLNLKDAKFSKIVLKSWNSIGHMEYDEMAYQLLISNFRNRNLPEAANDCYYDYRNDRRSDSQWLKVNWFIQPADYALMLFYGYGVKPDRPIIWSFVFIAIFAALFWWRQGILPVREGEPAEEANRFSLLEAAAFSAMTFLSGGKLVFDPPEYRIASGRPWRDVQISKALFILERLLGMVLIIMFAIAVGKTIILGGG
jgi:hypothetical protein